MKRMGVVLLGSVFLIGTHTEKGWGQAESRPDSSEAVVRDGKTLREWVEALKGDDAEVHLRAARALVEAGEPAYPLLVEAMSDYRQPIWEHTVEALVKIGGPAVPALMQVESVRGSGDLRHNGGVAALERMGAAAHPALKKALAGEDPDVRMAAVKALRLQMIAQDPAATVAVLADVLQTHKDRRVRAAAAEALGLSWMETLPSETAVPALIGALKDANDEVQGMAAVSLVKLDAWRGQDVVTPLSKALSSQEKKSMLPLSAAEALGEMGSAAEPAIPALLEAMRKHESLLATEAARTLGKIGPAAAPALRELLTDPNDKVRANAAEALGSAGAGSLADIPKLLAMAKEENPVVRAGALEGLGETRTSDDEAIAVLAAALEDKDHAVRNAAVRALGRLGSKAKQAVPGLTKLLGKTDFFDREEVTRTLGSIGPEAKDAVPALTALLPGNSRNVAEALGRIGTPAVPALIEALKNNDPEIRESAAWGLGYLGADARDAIPALTELLKPEEKACEVAMLVLRDMGPDAAAAVPGLLTVLSEGNKDLRSTAICALGEIGPGAMAAKESMVKVMGADDQDLRWEAAAALLKMGEVDAALPVVREWLRDDNAGLDLQWLDWLITAGPRAKSAAPVLAEAMHDEKMKPEIRIACGKTLIKIAPEDGQGEAFLRKRVAGQETWVSVLAALALVEAGKADAAATTRLKAVIPVMEPGHPQMVILLAGALTQVELERSAAIDLLRGKLQDKDGQVRVSAALAIASGGIADPAVVEILAGELRKKDGSGRSTEAVTALGKLVDLSREARAAVEEAQHAELESVCAAARAAIKSGPRRSSTKE